MKSLAIIGGGISGLALLHYLKQRCTYAQPITLYEREGVLGGNVHSEQGEGFLFETGPNGFLDNAPDTLELIEHLGLSRDCIHADSSASRRYIQINNTLQVLPMGPGPFLSSSLLSWKGKLRVLGGLKGEWDNNQSVYDYFKRRFGVECVDNIVDPFVSGIYAADIKKLHMGSTLARLGKKMSKKPHTCAFRMGMGELFGALGKHYAANIKTSAPVRSIDELSADHVICTAPAYAAADILRTKQVHLAKLLDEIIYAPVAVVGLAFEADAFTRRPDGFGYLIPSNQRKEILGVVHESNIFSNRAPDGKFMLRVMMGGRHHMHIAQQDSDMLLRKAAEEIKTVYGLKKGPLRHWVRVWPRAIPQYEMEYPSLLERIQVEASRVPGLTLAGNYIGGISFNDSINNAKSIAQSIAL